MANYQLPMGMFDPNSDYARQMAADEEERQRTAQQIVQQMNQQQATPTVTVQQPAQPQTVPMPNNNALAATAASALTPLTMGEQQFASIFKGLKSDYDVAKAANDVAGMQNAHTKAEAYADMAKRFGLDLDRIGRNDSADQLTARLDANRAAILNNISQMVSAPEFYEQQFNKYKAQGVSNGRAREMALNDTEAYEGKYNRIIGDAVPLYGANNKGEMDAIGTVLMNRMYQQSPQSVALYDQYLVNPHDLWKFDKNMEVQDKLYGQKLDYGQHQYEWTKDLNNDKFNFSLQLQKNQGDVQKTIAEMQLYYRGLEADKQRQFLLDNPALAPLINGGKANGEKELSDKEKTSALNIRDIYNAELQSLENVGATIEKLQAIKAKTADYDTRELIDDMCYSLNAHREAASWNDAGQQNRPTDNFRKYYEAVKRNPDLVEDLRYIYDDAVYKKDHPDQSPPRSKEWYDAKNHTYGINRMN